MASADPEFYQALTRDILVRVTPAYLPEQSEPESGRYVWTYRVNIENRGSSTVQLMRRTWRITDAQGRLMLVEGDGVVGEQPVLQPGEAFEYTSGTPLQTPSGFMAGAYHMVEAATGTPFDVTIPAFSLDSPYQPSQRH